MNLSWPIANVLMSPPTGPRDGSEIYISQVFGAYRDGYYAKYGHKGHNGLDIAAPEYTPIVAMHDGFIVEQTNKETGYGLRITQWFDDGEFEYDITYGHMIKLERDEMILWNPNYRGYPVKEGQVIGYVDSTGDSTGHHLHVTLRQFKDGQILNYNNGYGGAIDPLHYILKKGKEMEIYQVFNEQTLVLKNPVGLYFEIATPPELYPLVARTFGLKPSAQYPNVTREEVDANYGGQAKAGITLIEK